MAKGKQGPTKPGPGVGRYKTAEQKGRYTAPVPRTTRKSSPAYGLTVLALLLVGLLMILLNYLTVLPGSVTTWYLVVGLAMIFTGFVMATRYR
jgi:hypothetical protein